jgi:hypothetical protein
MGAAGSVPPEVATGSDLRNASCCADFSNDFALVPPHDWRKSQTFLCVGTNEDKKYLRMKIEPIH